MEEYSKCNFCKHYDEFDGCEWGCDNFEDYQPRKDRIIEKAKAEGISVADVIALINMG